MSTIRGVMNTLYNAAKDNMTTDELRVMSEELTEIAESHANDMRDVVEGIACLVLYDGGRKSAAGSFRQAEDVFALLVTIGRQFDVLAGMITVSSEANWKAGEVAREAIEGGDHE